MIPNLTPKLKITFNEGANQYELWIHYYDFTDKLYPLSYSMSVTMLSNLDVFNTFAERKYPDIYNYFNIYQGRKS